jgi:uncharacterized protein (TIGR04255 family)
LDDWNKEMSDYIVFRNAPIIEALLDIRVQLPGEVDLEKLKKIHDQIRDHFPEKQERQFLKAEIKLPTLSSSAIRPISSGADGYFFRSPSENKIVQFRLDGFTFNKLKPYETWDVFRDEARKHWDLYTRVANPLQVTRIALRYINRIDIPLPMKDFKEYILTVPEIAPNLPQALSHFFMRLVIPNEKIQATAIITQTMDNPTETQKLPLILDIDVWREAIYGPAQLEIWNDFEKLRLFKNEVFFNSITEKTKEFFK